MAKRKTRMKDQGCVPWETEAHGKNMEKMHS